MSMDFSIYIGQDGAVVLVPQLFDVPSGAQRHQPLTLLGNVQAWLDELGEEAVQQLGLYGFAVLEQQEAERLRARMRPSQ